MARHGSAGFSGEHRAARVEGHGSGCQIRRGSRNGGATGAPGRRWCAGGLVDLAEVSLESDLDLAALQGNSVTLATLAFNAIGTGTGTFNFVFDAFNDVKGNDAMVLSLTFSFMVSPVDRLSVVVSSRPGMPGAELLAGEVV